MQLHATHIVHATHKAHGAKFEIITPHVHAQVSNDAMVEPMWRILNHVVPHVRLYIWSLYPTNEFVVRRIYHGESQSYMACHQVDLHELIHNCCCLYYNGGWVWNRYLSENP